MVLCCAKSLQSCPTLWPYGLYSSPGSSVCGILQQEYWSGLPCPPPGDLPIPGIEPSSLVSSAVAGGFFTTAPPGKPQTSGMVEVLISLSSSLSIFFIYFEASWQGVYRFKNATSSWQICHFFFHDVLTYFHLSLVCLCQYSLFSFFRPSFLSKLRYNWHITLY